MSRAISDFLAQPVGAREAIKFDPDAPVAIPNDLKENIRFGFQKRMTLSGHGVVFDIEGRRVELSVEEMGELAEEMLGVVRSESPEKPVLDREAEAQLDRIVGQGFNLRRRGDLKGPEAVLLDLELVRALAYRLSDERRSEYVWRAQFMRNEMVRRGIIKAELLDNLIITVELSDWIFVWFKKSQYMRDCEALGVPVPPDFATSGTDWTFQGALSTNLLSPGAVANVWTWNRIGKRGACVALPRGSGGPGSLAGIICQSAETGNACFWDNLDAAGTRIPWASQTLVIKDLQDGTVLAENCTNCHKGNNVFNVSPDDPTWCKLLRGGQPGASCSAVTGIGSNFFTLAVEADVRSVNVPNTSIHHARYSPFSGTPSRPGWENNAGVSSCAGVCHLEPSFGYTSPSMPPSCGVDCW